jgi:hypothetical protein
MWNSKRPCIGMPDHNQPSIVYGVKFRPLRLQALQYSQLLPRRMQALDRTGSSRSVVSFRDYLFWCV